MPPPPGGYQLVLNGPTLQPGEEQEGCLWVPVPNPTDFAVSKFEFSLNPGTHHFALFEYIQPGAPETGVWHANDFGCFSGAPFGGAISGAPQAPYFRDVYPPGIARLIKAGGYIGLNAHYHNDFDVPIQIKVWSNLTRIIVLILNNASDIQRHMRALRHGNRFGDPFIRMDTAEKEQVRAVLLA